MRRTSWKFFSTLITLLTILTSSASFARDGHPPSTSLVPTPKSSTSAVIVWDPSCVITVEQGKGFTLEAPLKEDGTPDLSKLQVNNLVVQIKKNCGRVEVRKKSAVVVRESFVLNMRASALGQLPDFKFPEPPANMFCDPDYVSAPGEVMIPIKCGPTVFCDQRIFDTELSSCLLVS